MELRELLVVLGDVRLGWLVEDAILRRLLGLLISEVRKGVVSWMMVRIRGKMRFMQ